MIIMTKGLPASGKSTWAREAVRNDASFIRVNKDDLRAMCHDGVWKGNREKDILALRDAMIIAALERKRHVIVDDTNFAPKHEARLRELAAQYKVDFEVMSFDVDVEECIKRDAKRDKPVGEKVIRDMWRQYVRPEPPVNDPALPPAIIVDVDGTLADMGSRSPYDDHLAAADTVRMDVAAVVRALVASDPDLTVIICSGRDAGRSQTVTSEWLTTNGIPWTMLLMRAAGDTRKDSIIKRELFDAHVRGKYHVRFVMDDRDAVVRMWRDELGLVCHQVAPGAF